LGNAPPEKLPKKWGVGGEKTNGGGAFFLVSSPFSKGKGNDHLAFASFCESLDDHLPPLFRRQFKEVRSKLLNFFNSPSQSSTAIPSKVISLATQTRVQSLLELHAREAFAQPKPWKYV